jgi:hypothetical protein
MATNETVVAFESSLLVKEVAESLAELIKQYSAIDLAFASIVTDRINPETIDDQASELQLNSVQAQFALLALQNTQHHLNDDKSYEQLDRARPVLAGQAAAKIREAMFPAVQK